MKLTPKLDSILKGIARARSDEKSVKLRAEVEWEEFLQARMKDARERTDRLISEAIHENAPKSRIGKALGTSDSVTYNQRIKEALENYGTPDNVEVALETGRIDAEWDEALKVLTLTFTEYPHPSKSDMILTETMRFEVPTESAWDVPEVAMEHEPTRKLEILQLVQYVQSAYLPLMPLTPEAPESSW